MNFHGKARRLDDIDIPTIGARIGVGEDEIHAVLDVETRGGGFDAKGRPKMLFEPHIFYRELGEGARRDNAVAQGLAYKRWGAGKYPKDSYPRLLKAMAIDEEAALRSASWGLGQIMGFNCRMAGYPTARAMVAAFLDDEEEHLAAMVQFIKQAGLADALREHDWHAFAKGYNGSGYAKHGYHTKLEAAFRKWQGIRDTRFVPARAVPAPPKPIPPTPGPGRPPPIHAPRPHPSGGAALIIAIGAAIAAAVAWFGDKF